MSKPSVVKAGRQVIENKLLASLEDGHTVAILASERDLVTMIEALRFFGTMESLKHLDGGKALEMADDFTALRQAAFKKARPTA